MLFRLLTFLKRRTEDRQGFKRLYVDIVTLIKQGGGRRLYSEMKRVTAEKPLPKRGVEAYETWRTIHDYEEIRDGPALRSKLEGSKDLPSFAVIFIDGLPDQLPEFLESQIYQPEQVAGLTLSDVQGNPLIKTDYILFLCPEDQLSDHALAYLALTAKNFGNPALLYADHDQMAAAGERECPHFKPDWNETLFQSTNYVSRAFAIRRTAFEVVQPVFCRKAETLHFSLFWHAYQSTKNETPAHVPHVLFHLDGRTLRLSPSAPTRAAFLQKFAKEHTAYVPKPHDIVAIFQRPSAPAPKVSVLIPTRDRADLLGQCLDGLFEGTDYPDLEVIVIDNESKEVETFALFERHADRSNFQVVQSPGRFNFSNMINRGAQIAKGDVLCLLNNDVEVQHKDWLLEMVGWAQKGNVGAVGAKLLYPNRLIQHAGVVLGMRGAAGHAFKFFAENESGYFGRLQAAQEYSAVTGACLVVRTKLFQKVGGLDAESLAVNFNDVDFCLKLGAAGYRTIYTPYACLIHHESISRGRNASEETHARAVQERDFLKGKWQNMIENDPHYSVHLSRSTDDFSIG